MFLVPTKTVTRHSSYKKTTKSFRNAQRQSLSERQNTTTLLVFIGENCLCTYKNKQTFHSTNFCRKTQESLGSQYSELIKIKYCVTVRQKIETKGRLDARELQGLCSLSTPNPTMLIKYLWSPPLTVIQEPYSIPAEGDPKRHDPLIIVLSSLCGEANHTRQLGNVHQ